MAEFLILERICRQNERFVPTGASVDKKDYIKQCKAKIKELEKEIKDLEQEIKAYELQSNAYLSTQKRIKKRREIKQNCEDAVRITQMQIEIIAQVKKR